MSKRKQLIIDYQAVFGTDNGKRVLADLRKRCPFLTSSIQTDKGIDTNKLLLLEGERRVLLRIYTMLRLDPNEERPTVLRREEGE